MKLVYGAVKNDGSTVNAGSGDWSASRTTTGRYEIRFSGGFRNIPVVVACGGGDVRASDNVFYIESVTKDKATVGSRDVSPVGAVSDGAMDNASFSFIAIGSGGIGPV